MSKPVDDKATEPLLQRGLAELEALKAEVEKGLESAGAEARDGWQRLQPHLKRAETVVADKASGVAERVGESAADVIEDVRGRLEVFAKKLRRTK